MFCVLCVLLVAMAPAAWATDQQDLSVATETLLVLTSKAISPVIVAIIYDEAIPESKTDANSIKSELDKGLEAPSGIKLVPMIVTIKDLSGLREARMAFLAHGLGAPAFEAVSRAAKDMGLLTVSTDMDCVKSGKCVLGITTKPRVEIYYSRAAGDAAHVTFAPVFIMLAKEI